MATIIRFNIPTVVSPLLERYEEGKIINAVQADLNAGSVTKSKSEERQDWKTVKDDNGNERMVISVKTKAGESLQLENTVANRFYSWCAAVVRMQSFGRTEIQLPDVFKNWLDKFALIEQPVKK